MRRRLENADSQILGLHREQLFVRRVVFGVIPDNPFPILICLGHQTPPGSQNLVSAVKGGRNNGHQRPLGIVAVCPRKNGTKNNGTDIKIPRQLRQMNPAFAELEGLVQSGCITTGIGEESHRLVFMI